MLLEHVVDGVELSHDELVGVQRCDLLHNHARLFKERIEPIVDSGGNLPHAVGRWLEVLLKRLEALRKRNQNRGALVSCGASNIRTERC